MMSLLQLGGKYNTSKRNLPSVLVRMVATEVGLIYRKEQSSNTFFTFCILESINMTTGQCHHTTLIRRMGNISWTLLQFLLIVGTFLTTTTMRTKTTTTQQQPSFIFVAEATGSSRTSYNAYHYDRTTPQFTPDGRLLQVEYASMASDHSSPLIAIQVHDDDDDNDGTLLLVTMKQQSSTYNRMLVLDDSNMVIVMSGILADSVALLQVLLDEVSKHYRQCKTKLSLSQAANAMANACQRHAFGGGIRPYGSTMLVCGIVPTPPSATSPFVTIKTRQQREQQRMQVQIIQTDPSGAMIFHETSSSSSATAKVKSTDNKALHNNNNDDNDNMQCQEVRCIVGGTRTVQSNIRKALEKGFQRLSTTTSSSSSVLDTLATTIQVLLEQQQRQENETITMGNKNENNDDDDDENNNNIKNGDDENLDTTTTTKINPNNNKKYSLEVVVMSPTYGIHRLDESAVNAVWKRISKFKQ